MDIVKLTRCDFKAPYKAEIIYGIGCLPPIGMVTGWLNIDDTPEIKIESKDDAGNNN